MSCEEENTEFTSARSTRVDSSVIVMDGQKNDTAYLCANYKDLGATVREYRNGGFDDCPEVVLFAEASGTVNSRIPGTYALTYNAADANGKPLAPVTRTVHVVENSTGFLSGYYNVACSCTAVAKGSPSPTVTAENYTATVVPGAGRDVFELSALRIGPEKVIPNSSISGTAISIGCFGPDYASSAMSGTLSAAKNTFTIESMVYPYHPLVTYQCRNIYTKQMLIN